jgi:hypothetical protein
MLCQRRDLKVCILSWTNPEVNVICGDKCWAACIALRIEMVTTRTATQSDPRQDGEFRVSPAVTM